MANDFKSFHAVVGAWAGVLPFGEQRLAGGEWFRPPAYNAMKSIEWRGVLPVQIEFHQPVKDILRFGECLDSASHLALNYVGAAKRKPLQNC